MTKEKEPKLEPVKENHVVIEFSYQKLVLPYSDGVKIMEALKKVEQFTEGYSRTSYIKPIEEPVAFKQMSNEDYSKYKMNHILGVKEKHE